MTSDPHDSRVQTTAGPDGCTVVVTGDLDTAAAPEVGARLEEVLGRPEVVDVELDLSRVTFLNSAGLTALVAAHQAAERTGRALRIRCGASRAVRRPLQITGLSTVLTIVDA